MLILVIVVMIVIIIDKNSRIKYLEKKISSLEEKLKNLNGRIQLSSQNRAMPNPILSSQIDKINSKDKIENSSENVEKSQINISQRVVNEDENVSKVEETEKIYKMEKRKNETRNNAILAVGAAFIVVAAMSFLYSTWHTVPDIVKSAVILILAGVFLGLSRLAGKVFKLTKTAKAFFYIAMVYIPICLFSISLFGLAGEYFSINGDGRFIYLALASFSVMMIYLFCAYKNKDKKLYISGNLMQLIFVMCLSRIFINGMKEVLGILLIYSAALNIFVSKLEKVFLRESKTYREVVAYTFSGISVLILLLIEKPGLMIDLILAFGTFLNLFILYINKKSLTHYGILYGSVFILLNEIINIEIWDMPFIIKQIIVLIYIAISSYYHNFKVKDIKKTKLINWINLVVISILYFITKVIDEKCIGIPALVIIGATISTIEYIKNKREDYVMFATSLIINSVMILLPNSIIKNEVSLLNYLLCGMFAISMLFVLHKEKQVMLKFIPLILLFINLYRYNILISNTYDLTYLLNIIAIIAFGFLSIKDKNDIAYRVTSLLFLLGICIYAEIDIYVDILLVTIWSLIQMLFSENYIKKVMKGIIITSISLMYIIIITEDIFEITLKTYVLSIIESLLCWFIFSRSKKLKALPILGLMIPLYSYDLLALGKYDITFLINITLVIIFTYISVTSKKEKIYCLASFLYLTGLVVKYYEINIYIKFILYIIWGVIQYMHTEGKVKDIMKALIATCLLGVYMNIIEDINLNNVTAIKTIGFLAYAGVMIRGILKNYIEEYKIFEYVAYIIIYLCAFYMYNDEIDVAIFIVMQVIILMFTYVKRMGPAFAITLSAIVINMIYLTRYFWLSIPWWGYLVSVGGVLIVFAARNELSEKKDIKTVKEKIEKVKNYLDM